MIAPLDPSTNLLIEPTNDEIINRCVPKAEMVKTTEGQINEDNPVYLITWNPDPKELPNSDFNLQHQFNVNILSDYLKSCDCGLFCVESTQLGNPHYHGWYQVSATLEPMRIVHVKVMQRLGMVKITRAITIRKNTWFERKNGLYYYKKDLLDSMLMTDYNPINEESSETYAWASSMFFTLDLKNSSIQNKISDKQFYLQFYKDSDR